jgi:hypothetical protein
MGQGQSGPQGSPGSQGPRGDPGPQGPPGAPGKEASGDPTQVATLLSADNAFASKLAPLVAKDNAIGVTVAEKVASEQIPRQLFTNALLTNKDFSDKLIDSMAVDTRFRGVQGPPGSAFDDLSIQSALQPKSMWCADGQMCRIPTSAPGTYLTGDTVIQRNKSIYLGGASLSTSGTLSLNNRHGIVVNDKSPQDGPFIYGNLGGNLGTFDQVNSTSASATITWDANNVNVKGDLMVSGNLIQSAHDLKLGYKNVERGDSGASRALVKDTDNTLKINYLGDFVGGTTVDGPQLNVSGGKLKLGKWTIDGSDENNLRIKNKDNNDVTTISAGGNIDLVNKWRLRPDSDWFNIDNNANWKLSVHKDNETNVGDSLKIGEQYKIWANDGHLKFDKKSGQAYEQRATIDGTKNIGFVLGDNRQYQLVAGNGKCMDVGSHGQNCDWKNEHRRFQLEDSGYVKGTAGNK